MHHDKKATSSSVRGALKSASALIGLQAERTKLVNLTLPHAYAALGTALYSDRRYASDFPDLYGELDRLSDEQRRLTESKRHASASSLGERAQKLVGSAKDLAVAGTMSFQLQRLVAKLGEAAFVKYGNDAGEPAQVSPIADGVVRLAALDAELSSTSTSLKADGKALSSRRQLLFLAGGGSLVGIAAMGMFWASQPTQDKGGTADTNNHVPPPSVKAITVAIEHPPNQSPSFRLEVPEQNSFLGDVTCGKTENGELILGFTMSGWHRNTGLQGWPMVVRLFDRNGNYLTHFITQRFALEGMVRPELHEMLKIHELRKGANTLTYNVNMRDLRETEAVEISFLDTAMWARQW